MDKTETKIKQEAIDLVTLFKNKKITEQTFVERINNFVSTNAKGILQVKDKELNELIADLKSYRTSYSYVTTVENNIEKIVKTKDIDKIFVGDGYPKAITSN